MKPKNWKLNPEYILVYDFFWNRKTNNHITFILKVICNKNHRDYNS